MTPGVLIALVHPTQATLARQWEALLAPPLGAWERATDLAPLALAIGVAPDALVALVTQLSTGRSARLTLLRNSAAIELVSVLAGDAGVEPLSAAERAEAIERFASSLLRSRVVAGVRVDVATGDRG